MMRWGVPCVFLLLAGLSLRASDYFVSNSGNDLNDGLNETSAWATLDRVNAATLAPGDRLLFARGGVWRGSLKAQSGASGQPITYCAYGEGAKPLLLGSVAMDQVADWTEVRSNIWQAGQLPIPQGTNGLPNPSFDVGTANWSLWYEGGASASMARDTNTYDSPPAGLRVNCLTSGTAANHIQLYTGQMTITNGTFYTLQFSARCTQEFTIPKIALQKYGSPWTIYTSWQTGPPTIGTNWATYAVYFKASTSATDARITFGLGGGIPNGATLFLDTLSLRASSSANGLGVDVGNIILNGGDACGIKVWNEGDLDGQNEFWFDESNGTVRMYSTNNPASLYTSIECALRRHIIDETGVQWAVYDGLALSLGGAHGIGGGNTANIIARNCDISFIGGGDQLGGTNTVRYGNGIEFWSNASSNLVENCRLWEIYDAALTAQSNVENTRQINITFRNNLVWNAEYSFEFWNRPASSISSNVVFEYNTCLNAGGGWGHSQRPDPRGGHLVFYGMSATITNCLARHNIFSEATEGCVGWAVASQSGYVVLDYNCYNQSSGYVARIGTTNIAYTNFSLYQTSAGQDANSFMADPQLEGDGRLRVGSPCIDRAAMPGWSSVPSHDLAGVPRPLDGNADGVATPDIGCYEFVNENADTDADGLPDGWEIRYGLDPNDPADAGLDPDNDGFSNLSEYLAGTIPTSAASKLALDISSVNPSGAGAVLEFNSVLGRLYTVQYSDNLSAASWLPLSPANMPGTGSSMQITDTSPSTRRFYRLQVTLP